MGPLTEDESFLTAAVYTDSPPQGASVSMTRGTLLASSSNLPVNSVYGACKQCSQCHTTGSVGQTCPAVGAANILELSMEPMCDRQDAKTSEPLTAEDRELASHVLGTPTPESEKAQTATAAQDATPDHPRVWLRTRTKLLMHKHTWPACRSTDGCRTVRMPLPAWPWSATSSSCSVTAWTYCMVSFSHAGAAERPYMSTSSCCCPRRASRRAASQPSSTSQLGAAENPPGQEPGPACPCSTAASAGPHPRPPAGCSPLRLLMRSSTAGRGARGRALGACPPRKQWLPWKPTPGTTGRSRGRRGGPGLLPERLRGACFPHR